MKFFCITISLVVLSSCATRRYEPRLPASAWEVTYKKNEFNEQTNKPSGITINPEIIVYNTMTASTSAEYIISVIPVSKLRQTLFINILNLKKRQRSIVLKENPIVAVRTTRGIFKFKGRKMSSPKNMGVVKMNHADTKKIIRLIMLHDRLQISVQGLWKYHVLNVYGHGFADAWRETGWR